MKTRLVHKFMICRLYLNAMLLRHADEAQQSRNSCPWLLIDRLKWLCPSAICFAHRLGVSVCHLAFIVVLFEYLSSKLSQNVVYNVCDRFTKSNGDNRWFHDLSTLFEYNLSKRGQNVVYNVCDIFTKSNGDNRWSRDFNSGNEARI